MKDSFSSFVSSLKLQYQEDAFPSSSSLSLSLSFFPSTSFISRADQSLRLAAKGICINLYVSISVCLLVYLAIYFSIHSRLFFILSLSITSPSLFFYFCFSLSFISALFLSISLQLLFFPYFLHFII